MTISELKDALEEYIFAILKSIESFKSIEIPGRIDGLTLALLLEKLMFHTIQLYEKKTNSVSGLEQQIEKCLNCEYLLTAKDSQVIVDSLKKMQELLAEYRSPQALAQSSQQYQYPAPAAAGSIKLSEEGLFSTTKTKGTTSAATTTHENNKCSRPAFRKSQ